MLSLHAHTSDVTPCVDAIPATKIYNAASENTAMKCQKLGGTATCDTCTCTVHVLMLYHRIILVWAIKSANGLPEHDSMVCAKNL